MTICSLDNDRKALKKRVLVHKIDSCLKCYKFAENFIHRICKFKEHALLPCDVFNELSFGSTEYTLFGKIGSFITISFISHQNQTPSSTINLITSKKQTNTKQLPHPNRLFPDLIFSRYFRLGHSLHPIRRISRTV
ncbi:hypothetical protein RJT34_18030 [Clitoria ternatea]|uniref:Uncharacterized protein n=1 Tax=Clitoria ternatea TaxID=43366 RepID=A0AAN9JBI3_CLITE